MYKIKAIRTTAPATATKNTGINALLMGSLILISSLSVDANIIAPDVNRCFDPFAGIVRTPTRNILLSLRRPSPVITAARCVETIDVTAPDFGQLPFIPFTTDPLLADLTLSSGDGIKSVCCQFRDDALTIEPAMCASIELTLGVPAPVPDLLARAKPGKVDLVWTPQPAAINFEILRADVSGGQYVSIGLSVIGVFVDRNATSGQTYFYVVDSIGPSGRSGNSNEVQITVPTKASRIR